MKKKLCCCCCVMVVVVVAVVVFSIVVSVRRRGWSSDDPMFAPDAHSAQKRYSQALQIAMQFFDVQKSGKLVDNKIPWRGDSALQDGSVQDLDLSKGMYDAGDHMKFGFPMAFTATVLSWAILEYGTQMEKLDQLKPAQDSLKWITDFLIIAHPSPNVLYVQVGDPKLDHECWERPENMKEKRPLKQVNTESPGSDVAAETAAAMASASLVFKSTDPKYSVSLVKHATQLFNFADKNRALYSESIPEVATYYNSTGYGDELLWAASWLYHATGNKTFIDYVSGKNGKAFAKFGSPTWFSWDNKLAGTQVLLSRTSFFDSSTAESLESYKKTAEAVMCGLLKKSPTATNSRTKSGLIWVAEWNALQHPVASAFLALLYSDYMVATKTSDFNCEGVAFGSSDLREFAMSQADYVLGKNPMKMSYLVGFGTKYPEYVHHRGASIPAEAKTGCKDGWKWLASEDPNPNVATGALVGGPFMNETYIDKRNNSMQGEPSTYNSAVLVGLLSGLASEASLPQSLTPNEKES